MRWAVLVLAAGCSSVPAPRAMEWRAGTARAKITPAEPVMMAGYGSRNKVSEGVAAELWARALAVEDSSGQKAVVVTADMIGFGPVMSRRIKSELAKRHGLGEERVLLVGSHTHNGPVIAERTLVDHPEQAKEKDAYVDRLVRDVVEVVGESLGHLGPARLRFARGEARFGMNRRVNEGGYEAGWHIATGRGFGAMQMAWSGWSTPFAAGVEDRIVGAVHEMMRE